MRPYEKKFRSRSFDRDGYLKAYLDGESCVERLSYPWQKPQRFVVNWGCGFHESFHFTETNRDAPLPFLMAEVMGDFCNQRRE